MKPGISLHPGTWGDLNFLKTVSQENSYFEYRDKMNFFSKIEKESYINLFSLTMTGYHRLNKE